MFSFSSFLLILSFNYSRQLDILPQSQIWLQLHFEEHFVQWALVCRLRSHMAEVATCLPVFHLRCLKPFACCCWKQWYEITVRDDRTEVFTCLEMYGVWGLFREWRLAGRRDGFDSGSCRRAWWSWLWLPIVKSQGRILVLSGLRGTVWGCWYRDESATSDGEAEEGGKDSVVVLTKRIKERWVEMFEGRG